MRLHQNAHLAYCTNVHPGNDWQETFHSLENDVLAVKRNVCPDQPFAIGLRLSAVAAQTLSQPAELAAFQLWLEKNNCYVFTINGFPYGAFHGESVKEKVYLPDWSSSERLEYTNRLFDILTAILPPGVAGSVSTLPGSFKRFVHTPEHLANIHENLYRCFQHIETLSERHHADLHLGLEPEPLGLFETSKETVAFFDRFLIDRPNTEDILHRIGVNYDTCHLAVEYEDAPKALDRLERAGIRISKIHLSSALKLVGNRSSLPRYLAPFHEDTYLHQVIEKRSTTDEEELVRYEDLPQAIAALEQATEPEEDREWRIHFHIPVHHQPQAPLASTSDQLLATLDHIDRNPEICHHFEIETYTWDVLPHTMKSASLVDQIGREYHWVLAEMQKRPQLSR